MRQILKHGGRGSFHFTILGASSLVSLFRCHWHVAATFWGVLVLIGSFGRLIGSVGNTMSSAMLYLKYLVCVPVWLLRSMLQTLQGEIFACQFCSISVVSTSERGWQPSQVVADASSFFSSTLKSVLTSLAGGFPESCMCQFSSVIFHYCCCRLCVLLAAHM